MSSQVLAEALHEAQTQEDAGTSAAAQMEDQEGMDLVVGGFEEVPLINSHYSVGCQANITAYKRSKGIQASTSTASECKIWLNVISFSIEKKSFLKLYIMINI